MPILIAPSILASDLSNIRGEITKIIDAGADLIHLDIMDGQFVPPITYGDCIVSAVKRCTTLPLDVHLMIKNPEQQIEYFAQAGANIITVHIENYLSQDTQTITIDSLVNVKNIIDMIHSYQIKAGISLNPQTPLDIIKPFIPQIDTVLIMSVQPGWCGQKYISATNQKIAELRTFIDTLQKTTKPLIEVDGGINAETARDAIANGADILVAGSFIFNNENYAEQIRKLTISNLD